MKTNKGIFISFEGPEASGKSSQIILLKNYLKKKSNFSYSNKRTWWYKNFRNFEKNNIR